MGEIPYTKVVPITELGDGASVTILNPWMLPEPAPIPRELLKREGFDLTPEQEEARIVALTALFTERGRSQLALIVKAWSGVLDAQTLEPLPLPKDDPTVYDRCPQAVKVKIEQAIQACTRDMEWDPTKRPTPPEEVTPPEAKTLSVVSSDS